MDFYLFKQVLFGDVSSIIFHYSRLFTEQYVKQVLQLCDCGYYTCHPYEHPINYLGHEFMTANEKGEPDDGMGMSLKSFFSNPNVTVLVPFDRRGYRVNELFEFNSWSGYDQGSFTHHTIMWNGKKKDYYKCLKNMRRFSRFVHSSTLIIVKINDDGTIKFNWGLDYKPGYCPLLFVDKRQPADNVYP